MLVWWLFSEGVVKSIFIWLGIIFGWLALGAFNGVEIFLKWAVLGFFFVGLPIFWAFKVIENFEEIIAWLKKFLPLVTYIFVLITSWIGLDIIRDLYDGPIPDEWAWIVWPMLFGPFVFAFLVTRHLFRRKTTEEKIDEADNF